jgi:cytochrome P450
MQPFGIAKRKCPGWMFPIVEGLVFMSVIFRRFKVKLVKGHLFRRLFIAS